ncbi:MAG: tellurite resistance TerB family protein [Calditrichia bacterium]|nr:tellurite resistance TerB family protein [Calditrichia bacterium]
MKIKFHSVGEGFVAVATLVMHADGVASKKELNLILKNFVSQPLKVLKVTYAEDLFNFFWETQHKILGTYHRVPITNEVVIFSKKEVKDLIEAAREVLNPDIRETAYLLACELAYADGLTESEEIILEYIQKEFEINQKVVKMIKEIVPIKYRNPIRIKKELQNNLPIHLETVAEAMIAIELAITFADEDVNLKQTIRMFWNLTLLNIFIDKDPGYYYQVMHKILNIFDKQLDNPVPFNEKEINDLILACNNVLDSKSRETALWVATELAYATDINDQEKSVLDHLVKGMDIDNNIARKINKIISIKFRS